MIKKKQKYIYLSLITMLVGISPTYAFTYGVSYANTGSGGQQSNKEPNRVYITSEGNIDYYCEYDFSIGAPNNITINGYNNGKSIMDNSLKISTDDRIESGTAIQLNIYETKYISWAVTKAEVKKVTKEMCNYYNCSYTNKSSTSATPVPKPNKPNGPKPDMMASINLLAKIKQIALNCSSHYQSNVTSCPTYYGCITHPSFIESRQCGTKEETTTNYQSECNEKAAKAAISAANSLFYPSYQVDVSDSNDIEGNTTTALATQTSCSPCSFGYSGAKSGSAIVTYTYRLNKACMNVKTATVRYTQDIECKEDEIEVEDEIIDGRNYWNYFIPLNAKSNQEVEINLRPIGNGSNLVKEQCQYVMEHNPISSDSSKTTYIDLIIKKDKTNFKGDFSLGERGYDYNEIVENGCLLTSKVKIPAVQKFYGETSKDDETLKFKGFNFYYKPISVNTNEQNIAKTVFPNGITDTSIWKEWYQSEKKELDLTKSYNIVTYTALNINIAKIRNYNRINQYTDWSNMNLDGTSKFIDNYGIVSRNTKNDVYKLGCGPTNAEWSDCK